MLGWAGTFRQVSPAAQVPSLGIPQQSAFWAPPHPQRSRLASGGVRSGRRAAAGEILMLEHVQFGRAIETLVGPG